LRNDLPIDDIRIRQTRPLIQPAILTEEIVRTPEHSVRIAGWRNDVEAVIRGDDQRLLVIAGPCSIHDPEAALEFAEQLKGLGERYSDDLLIVMRAYFEKPRTVGGWKGLINDPELDGTHKINKGLRLARGFLRDLAELGIAAGTEFLDTTVPQHIADLVSWGAIGARTVESQTHRELASGLSMPIGFKNATDGRIQPAVDAVLAAARSHWFPSTTKEGVAALSETTGNESCHIILRGGQSGPNFEPFHIAEACERLRAVGRRPSVMVDCSHGNSGKDHARQPVVNEAIARQIEEVGSKIFGVMIEAFLVEGRQDYSPDGGMVNGQSITDACVNLGTCELMLERLAQARAKVSA
jgi:3-deoxy-7-phosphoheptulonate synthase